MFSSRIPNAIYVMHRFFKLIDHLGAFTVLKDFKKLIRTIRSAIDNYSGFMGILFIADNLLGPLLRQ